MSALTTTQFIRDALSRALSEDDRVFIMGEDIAAYGGSFGVTRGLLDAFGPERIRNTPISEPAFTGMAIGAAVAGSRPIVEIMFMDFATLCVDQLVNMAAKLHYVYGQSCPLVLRTAMGAGRSYGATHSQCLERLFTGIPGLKVVAGSDGPDCAALLLGALADPNPVIVLEHKLLYPLRFEEPATPIVPVAPGAARVTRPGTDVTIVAWSYMAHLALQAAATLAEEEIEAEVVDVRSLAPLDVPEKRRFLSYYERLSKKCFPVVFRVREGNGCPGCHMVLPPSKMQEAQRNAMLADTPGKMNVVACDYCGRLIFK